MERLPNAPTRILPVTVPIAPTRILPMTVALVSGASAAGGHNYRRRTAANVGPRASAE